MSKNTQRKEEENAIKRLNAPAESRSGSRVEDDYMHNRGLPRWYSNNKLRVDYVSPQRYERGVFTKEGLKDNEVLEEVPFVNLAFYHESQSIINFLKKNPNIGSPYIQTSENFATALKARDANEYIFDWSGNTGQKISYSVLPLGNGAIYNSSPTPNCEWLITGDSFIFKTIKEIKKGSELRTFYGYFLTDSGEKVTPSDVLGMYVELDDDQRICLKSVLPSVGSLPREKCDEINAKCLQENTYVNQLNFYTSGQEVAATLRSDKIQSTDYFYEKVREARVKTDFTYMEVSLFYDKNSLNKEEVMTLYSK